LKSRTILRKKGDTIPHLCAVLEIANRIWRAEKVVQEIGLLSEFKK